jgi:hypothetical protein
MMMMRREGGSPSAKILMQRDLYLAYQKRLLCSTAARLAEKRALAVLGDLGLQETSCLAFLDCNAVCLAAGLAADHRAPVTAE